MIALFILFVLIVLGKLVQTRLLLCD